jgi:hypothetical protein
VRVALLVLTAGIGAVGLALFVSGAVLAFRHGLDPKEVGGRHATIEDRPQPGRIFARSFRLPGGAEGTGVRLSGAQLRALWRGGRWRKTATGRAFVRMIGGMFLVVVGGGLTAALIVGGGTGLYVAAVSLGVPALILFSLARDRSA